MDHNRFDYEHDLLSPIKDFLKRNTNFIAGDVCDIKIPSYLFDTPKSIKKEFFEMHDKEVNVGCFGS